MRTLIAVVAATVVLAACGGGETGGPVIDRTSDDVILTVTDEGGFAPVASLLGRLPRYVLRADGTIYTPGAVPAIYPGPLVTPVQVGTLAEDAMDEIGRIVDEMGLAGIDRTEDTTASNRVADATTTVIRYTDEAGDHVVSVYALGIVEPRSDLVSGAARLIDALDRGVADLSDTEFYAADRIEVRTGEGIGLADEEFRNTRPWPLAIAPDEMSETSPGWRCEVIEGPSAGELLEIFESANQATAWDHEGTLQPLVVRMLLPGEAGCA